MRGRISNIQRRTLNIERGGGARRYCFGRHVVPEKQLQVWREMAMSNTTKGIALDLHIGEKAVEYHRAKLYRNLGIFDVAGITREAIKTGVIKL